jgi:hypothetical protein
MEPQHLDWTCAACSLHWLLHASGIDPLATREGVIQSIGHPDNINAQVGLVDGSGKELRRVLLDEYGVQTGQSWLDFDTVYQLAQHTTGMMSGARWYHWCAIRGVQGSSIFIANSAPGYRGVFDILTREDFERLGGFSVVWLEGGEM